MRLRPELRSTAWRWLVGTMCGKEILGLITHNQHGTTWSYTVHANRGHARVWRRVLSIGGTLLSLLVVGYHLLLEPERSVTPSN
jgi:hypothetical protein